MIACEHFNAEGVGEHAGGRGGHEALDEARSVWGEE